MAHSFEFQTLLISLPSWEIQHLGSLCLYSTLLGVLAHVLYFVHGNRAHEALGIASFHLSVGSALYYASFTYYGCLRGYLFATALCSSYAVGTLASIGIYRALLHPLSQFPGPTAAALTKFYGPWIARHGRMHWEHGKLRDAYGKFVRIAPNELLIDSIDAIQKVHGSNSGSSKKGTFYEFISVHGVPNLDSIADHDTHRARRVFWDKAFNTKGIFFRGVQKRPICQYGSANSNAAMYAYEIKMHETIHDWLSKLSATEGQSINTSLYSLLIPFDNIGKVGYSHEFGLVIDGKENRYLTLLEAVFGMAGKMGQSTWPLAIANALRLNQEQREAEALGVQMLNERIKNDSPEKEDMVKYFLEDYNAEQPRAFHNKDILDADSLAILVGGTDTIAVVLSYSFYELARDPKVRHRFLDAISPVYGKTVPDRFTSGDLGAVPYVDAFINEVMRLYNPTANNGPRTVPPQGIEINGKFIPGGTSVVVPIHLMHRSKEYFAEPASFIPERWTTRPELVLERRAFHPFLYGPYNCPGQRLAYALVRLVLATTLWNYDFDFAPGENGVGVHEKAMNNLIIKAGPLNCVFHKRTFE